MTQSQGGITRSVLPSAHINYPEQSRLTRCNALKWDAKITHFM